MRKLVIKDFSVKVNPGDKIAIVGPTGAGKTTILHTVTGLLKPKTGTIIYNDNDITKTPAHKIVTMGMAHVPEGRRIFQQLTVIDNIKLGAFTRKDKKEIDPRLAILQKLLDNPE